jgi:hypothetical protein
MREEYTSKFGRHVKRKWWKSGSFSERRNDTPYILVAGFWGI